MILRSTEGVKRTKSGARGAGGAKRVLGCAEKGIFLGKKDACGLYAFIK